MGWIQDLLQASQELPLSAVLRERVELADQKHETALREIEDLKRKNAALERENAELRAQIPEGNKEATLGEDTKRVMVQIFRAAELEQRDVGVMARALGMDWNVLQYHLDRLRDAGFARNTGLNYLDDHVYWALTPAGRQYVVERKLI